MSRISLEQLADIEEIKQLKYKYCRFCDDGYDPDGIASCYAENGGLGGTPEKPQIQGREALRNLFRTQSQLFPFAIHSVHNPIIEVTGDHATGSWQLFQPCTINRPEGLEAAWIAGSYSDIYVREAGRWVFEWVNTSLHFVTPFSDGWIKTPMAMPGM